VCPFVLILSNSLLNYLSAYKKGNFVRLEDLKPLLYLKYMSNCLKESSYYLRGSKVRFLARDVTKIASLLKPPLKRLYNATKLKFIVKADIVKDSIILQFGSVFDYLVDLFIIKLYRSPSISNSCALGRIIV
jgi:hypothetical protein